MGTGRMPKPTTPANWGQRFKSAFLGAVLGLTIPSLVLAQTTGPATLLPNAAQQYLDDSGQPLASGQVYYYIPNTNTKATVWQDAGETTPQANPVQLDAAGRPQPAGQTFGSGCYQQKVVDVNNVQIWSYVTCSTGSGGSTSSGTILGDGAPVGTVLAWSGLTLPSSNWMYASGQSLARASYPQLLSQLAVVMPNAICVAGSTALSGLGDVSQLPVGTAIESSCVPPGTTIVTPGTTGSVIMSNAASVSTTSSATFFPFGDGDRATTFTLPSLNGNVIVGRNNMGGTTGSALSAQYYGVSPNAINAVGGGQANTQRSSDLPNITLNVTGSLKTHADVTDVLRANAGLTAITPVNTGSTTYLVLPAGSGPLWDGVSTSTVSTGDPTNFLVTNLNTAAQTSTSRIPPSVTLNYIIKVQPDTNPGYFFTGSVLAAVNLATTGALSNSPTYNNGSSGVGATLTGSSNGALTVDSVAVAVGNRVLVNNETDQTHNGIYSLTTLGTGSAPYMLTRTTDFNSPSEMSVNATTLVLSGTQNSGTKYTLTKAVMNVGSNPVVFVLTSAAVIATCGFGIICSGTTVSLDPAAPELSNYVASNSSPATQTIQSELRKIPVSCEDFGVCGTADDSIPLAAAMQYAAMTTRPFQFNGNYNVSSLALTMLGGNLLLTGRGGLVGQSGISSDAVFNIKNSTGITMDGNITINCSSNSGYGAGLKLWSDGTSSGAFNRLSFSEFANCPLAYQIGDPSAGSLNVSLSEITISGGFLYNTAQGIKAIGGQTLVHVNGFINDVDNTNWSGITAINHWAVGATINVVGGEAINTVSSTGKIVQLDTVAATGNPYGIVNINSTEIEIAGALMNSSNPAALSSPTGGGFSVENSFGYNSNTALAAIQTDSQFTGPINVLNNRFFAGTSRSVANILSGNAAAPVFFDLASFRTNYPQGYAGISGGSAYMTSKDIAPVVTMSGTSGSQLLASSVISFVPSNTYTFTMLSAAAFPGRSLYLSTTTAFAINSASSNILQLDGTTSAAILPATAKSWAILVASGNLWQIVASGPGTGGGSTSPGGSSGQVQFNNSGAFGGFTASGDATINTSTGALTLATVNSNVGSFGSATQCVAFTTNAKGLITAASAVTCTPAVASLIGLGTGVATALAVNVGTAGAFVVNGGALGTPSSGAVATTLLTGTLQAAQEPAHTGDVTNTAGSLALTLATVNSNVGSFGSTTNCPTFTVNGKGLITAASQAGCAFPTALPPNGSAGGSLNGTYPNPGVVNATQAQQQTGTSTTVVVTPAVQQYHDSAIKAWVAFTGTTGAVQSSYNVSSVVRNSVGNYTINFTTSFTTTTYSCVVGLEGGSLGVIGFVTSGSRTTSSVGASTVNTSLSGNDAQSIFVNCEGR